MSKLIKSTLENLCLLVTDGTHDSPKLQDSGIPFIKAKHISNGFVDFSTCDYITYDEHLKVIARSKPEKGDILFTHIGASLGVTAYINKNIEFSIKNIALFKPNLEKIDSLYLYYLVTSHEFQEDIKNRRTGSAQPFVSLDTLRKYEVTHHNNLLTQQKIAGILSAYDDLIENNTRRIEILEEMARMLYREWFVKFRFPGHEAVQFVESELGLIPEGWEVKKLKEFIEIKHGYAFKGEFFSKDPTPNILLTPGNFKFGGGFKWDKLKYYDGEIPSDFILKNGDLIVTMTDLSKLGDTLGYPALVPPSKDLKFLHNQRIGKVNFKNQKLGLFYLYYLLCSDSYRGHVLGTATGSTVKHTAPDRIKDFSFILSESDILNQFEKIAASIIHQTVNLESKNINLRKTRDLLLPRLISGEIDVENLDINTGIQP